MNMAGVVATKLVKPKLIVFDLDCTLWPFHVDTNVDPPFHKNGNTVYDSRGKVIKHFPEVPKILEYLLSEGYELAAASRTREIKGANELLNLFGWNDIFKYKEIYPTSKTVHFQKFKSYTGVEYKDMLFFDDEFRNIRDVSNIGSCAIHVSESEGMTMDLLQKGFTEFSKKYNE